MGGGSSLVPELPALFLFVPHLTCAHLAGGSSDDCLPLSGANQGTTRARELTAGSVSPQREVGAEVARNIDLDVKWPDFKMWEPIFF